MTNFHEVYTPFNVHSSGLSFVIQGDGKMSGRVDKRNVFIARLEWTWCGILFEEIHCNNKCQNTMVHSTVSRSVNVFCPATSTKHIHRKRRHVLKFLQKMKPLALNCTIFYTHAFFKQTSRIFSLLQTIQSGDRIPVGARFFQTHPDRPWGSTSLP